MSVSFQILLLESSLNIKLPLLSMKFYGTSTHGCKHLSCASLNYMFCHQSNLKVLENDIKEQIIPC